MKAAIIERFGPPEVISMDSDFPKSQAGKNQVLVKIHATSVNPVDWKIRRGDLKLFYGSKFPRVLGSDIAGEVVDANNSPDFAKGDRVYGLASIKSGGGSAEFIAIDKKSIVKIPENLNFEQAASIPLAGLTAFQALYYKGNVKPGNLVLINGASGGVGTFAVQIAKAYGALVTATCSKENIDLVGGIGADEAVDYNETDILKIDEKYDIIFDAVAKSSFGQMKKILSPDGTYITTIPSPGHIANSILGPFKMILGNRQKAKSVMVGPSREDLLKINEFCEDEKVTPVIDKIYLLEEIAEAHAYSETGRVKGKLVIKIV